MNVVERVHSSTHLIACQVVYIMNIGERINKERKRLGYTQAAFAKVCGVHRNTQIKYESGERDPDASYLAVIAQNGVDVVYVLTGKSEAQECQSVWRVVSLLQENLKLVKYDKDLDLIYQLALEDVKNFHRFDEKSLNIEMGTNRAVYEFLKKSPVVFMDMSFILQDVIEKLEFVLDVKGLKLYPSEKAEVISELVKKSKSGDRLDLETVKELLQPYKGMK
ncbi:XRE family transcriptional regulator [Salmonella enterica]|nr:XRE family transcriptional regulator [Salmonella enterica]EBQ2127375.1 helix-turn-helix transcriptional regulator [Salmonella enterica]EBT1279336.1 helix-turn-helix transcriptional regulator [Salmonella enterica]MIV19587.1 XRE family transcriptional regulator [Salmonella enterica]